MNTTEILAQLDAEITRLQHVRSVLSGLTSTSTVQAKRSPGRPRTTATPGIPKKRQISAAGRARIAAAQKARWAKSKKLAKAA